MIFIKGNMWCVSVKSVLGDGSIDVWDDDFVIPVPKVDGAFTAARALVLRCDAEGHIVGSFFQFQTSL